MSADGSPLDEHARFLWGLCYRMMGSAADADDLVQETFVRAIERPPPDREAPLRPWLTRVALNLGRDALRRRKRRRYDGPWLPTPVDDLRDRDEPPSVEVGGERSASGVGGSTEARYDLLESVSLAFLVALEALTPKQRAIVLLCDVFDYSSAEAAAALGLSIANVKTTHHRARRALEPYERARPRPGPGLAEATRAALNAFLGALASGDVGAVESLLAEDVRALSDGGGELTAARRPVLGRSHVARLFAGLMRHAPPSLVLAPRELNGLPGAWLEQEAPPRVAPRIALQVALDRDGRIASIFLVQATAKLAALVALSKATVKSAEEPSGG